MLQVYIEHWQQKTHKMHTVYKKGVKSAAYNFVNYWQKIAPGQ